MLRAWQNESTFGKHDRVSNVAATMCPHSAGPLETKKEKLTDMVRLIYGPANKVITLVPEAF